ncbi:type II secretion system protein GspL, partial [Kaarinaea lacus]
MRKSMVLQLPGQWPGTGEDDASFEEYRTSWVLRDDDNPIGSLFYGDLKEAATQAVGARVTVLVPGEDVLLARAQLPEMKGQKLARAVPFALEEQLANDAEDVHVAIGRRDASGKLANAVILRETIDSWLSRLREAGLHPDVMSPEV